MICNSIGSSNSIVQFSYIGYTTWTTAATIIPQDNTIPQNTEGVEIALINFTPISASNNICIEVTVHGSGGGTPGYNLISSLFTDANANSICTNQSFNIASFTGTHNFTYSYVLGSITAVDYKLRISKFCNGNSGSRIYGGVSICYLSIYENYL